MKSFKLTSLLCVVVISIFDVKVYALRQFPENLIMGFSSASYQMEGGWNASGKGESIWDRLVHTTDLIKDGSSGDVACDSYHQHKRDIELLQEVGAGIYRISLSWSRILPEGYATTVNEDGIRYYNEVINDLLAANIIPSVTLYHWDLPQPMQDIGGWENPKMVEYFADYANVAFEAFGDRVEMWLTLNEPWVTCVEGYGGTGKAPALGLSGTADYRCAHNILKAHAKAYHLYDEVYRPKQNGRVGLTLNANWNEPETDTPEDKQAAERYLQFFLGWYAHPIYSQEGDYPQVMKDKIKQNSINQGYNESRLPKFTQEEIDYIKGTSDFFGVNHYTTYLTRTQGNGVGSRANYWEDIDVYTYQDPSWPTSASDWLTVVPWGFRSLLNWIKNEYNVPEIMVFENGFPDRGEIDDVDRINYFHGYLNSMLDAIEDGVNVTLYTAWSIMDNFEWESGYTERYGLYYIDFEDPARPRTPKSSVQYFKDILNTRTIEESDVYPKKYLSYVDRV